MSSQRDERERPQDPQIVVVKLNERKHYVVLEQDEKSLLNFKKEIRRQLFLQNTKNFNILDDNDVMLSQESFSVCAPSYYVIEEISTTDSVEEADTGRVEELRHYFQTQKSLLIDGEQLLREDLKLNSSGAKPAITIIRNHLLEKNGHPSKKDKIDYAKATIQLFPGLKIPSFQGYEGVYNPETQGGLLGNSLKAHWRNKKKKNDEGNENTGQHNNKKKRKNPQNFQDEQQNKIPRLPTSLEFYCEVYGAVQSAFESSYPDNPNALQNLFTDNFQFKLLRAGNSKQITHIDKNCPMEIYAAYMWITLFPPTSNRSGRCNVRDAVDDLLSFYQNHEDIQETSFPKIIAVGPSINSITEYFVGVGSRVITTNNTFIDSLDIMFKLHIVGNLEYNPSLTNFMTYIEKCVFHLGSEWVPRNTTLHKGINALLD